MKHHKSITKAHALYGLSIISFFISLHLSIPNYFNSSFLSTFADERAVSLIYLIISMITVIGLLSMNTILHRFGNFRTSITLIVFQLFVFYQLIHSTTPGGILLAFILSMSIVSLIIFTIDIFVQRNSTIRHTGAARGLVMTATNMAWVVGPLLGGLFIVGEDYRNVYIVSFALLFPLLYLVYKNFNTFKDSKYVKTSVRETFIRILKSKDISRIFIVNIVLQTFYAWMTVYVPIYLHNTIGFDWSEISIILTVMLIPFVLIELPLGRLADKKWGEKEILICGFIIMGIATGALAFFSMKSVIIWALMLFLTRIGAAAAEIMIETYFFKKMDDKDPELLGMFRTTRSLSFFIAPLVVLISLLYVPESSLFLVFGIICLLTLQPIATLKDTN